ncbi:MAG: hypothetical protein ACI8P9_004674 [Parasphingorhabdus sp.]|jgi:hypothetical protein
MAKLEPMFEFRFNNPVVLQKGALLKDRRDASIAFYLSCIDNTVNISNNPFLDWMNQYYPNRWHDAVSQEERILLCRRYQQLLADIAKNGIQQPVRMLEPKLFGRPEWHNFFDGGNRTYIAAALKFREIPCLIHPDHYPIAKQHNLI